MPTKPTPGSRNASRPVLCAASLVLSLACCQAVADINQDGIDDIGLLVPNFGVGPAQHAELALDNRNCKQDVVATVTTTDGKGLIAQELVHVVQGGAAVYTLPMLESRYPEQEGRQQYSVVIHFAPGPCVSGLEGTLSLVTGDGSTVAMHHIPAHTPEWTNQSAHNPGTTILKGDMNDYVHIPPVRVGPRQAAEFVFWNQCNDNIALQLNLDDVQSGESQSVNLDIPASAFQLFTIPVPEEGPAVTIRGFGAFAVNNPDAAPCPPGGSPLNGTLSIVNPTGETTVIIQGLPTGKRRHKPF